MLAVYIAVRFPEALVKPVQPWRRGPAYNPPISVGFLPSSLAQVGSLWYQQEGLEALTTQYIRSPLSEPQHWTRLGTPPAGRSPHCCRVVLRQLASPEAVKLKSPRRAVCLSHANNIAHCRPTNMFVRCNRNQGIQAFPFQLAFPTGGRPSQCLQTMLAGINRRHQAIARKSMRSVKPPKDKTRGLPKIGQSDHRLCNLNPQPASDSQFLQDV